jgi:hypothetical protein
MTEAKHSFVDDNPYLVYSPNAEATSEGGSGGGGGAGFPVIEANAETGALSVTAGALKTMLDASPVIMTMQGGDVNPNLIWVTLSEYIISDAGYYFAGFALDSSEESIETFKWTATTASDYPTINQGE